VAFDQCLSHRFEIKGGDFAKAGRVSLEVKEILHDLGIDPVIARRVAIVSYEAEMNVVMYATRGEMVLQLDPEAIRIVLEDEGPGIRDTEMAMREGYSTATEQMREMGFGAGMGLPNIKKNADRFELTSEVGKGTCCRIVIHLSPGGRA
jgi:serine/threonine-protein kinase RsbT